MLLLSYVKLKSNHVNIFKDLLAHLKYGKLSEVCCVTSLSCTRLLSLKTQAFPLLALAPWLKASSHPALHTHVFFSA